MSVDLRKALEAFESHFGAPPDLAARAPGRVNLIGEHTDYNAGFVLPMAIERDTLVLARSNQSGRVRCLSGNLQREAQIPLQDLQPNPDEPWADYVTGVLCEWQAADLRFPEGADLLLSGDIPLGSGLSSSASLEMALVKLLEQHAGMVLPDPEAAAMGQRVENSFLGLNSGIMDQFTVRCARSGHALFLDCRSLDYTPVKATLDSAVFVIADTGRSRELAASKYNERVRECAEAVKEVNEHAGTNAITLREFESGHIQAASARLSPTLHRRARHVVSENQRTMQACEALSRGDLRALGALMNASHLSLREDYEVSCRELDIMTDIARTIPGCLGARMTGAGFGGCSLNLVELEAVQQFSDTLLSQYKQQTGLRGNLIVTKPAEGVRAVSV